MKTYLLITARRRGRRSGDLTVAASQRIVLVAAINAQPHQTPPQPE
jgi:hypothetical protein